jgi:hypothetical protein
MAGFASQNLPTSDMKWPLLPRILKPRRKDRNTPMSFAQHLEKIIKLLDRSAASEPDIFELRLERSCTREKRRVTQRVLFRKRSKLLVA